MGGILAFYVFATLLVLFFPESEEPYDTVPYYVEAQEMEQPTNEPDPAYLLEYVDTPTYVPVAEVEEPTDEPTPEPVLAIVSAPEIVRRNENVTVSIVGLPYTEYSITVFFGGNASTASGLGSTITDTNGYASWTWQIGGRTNAQNTHLTIRGGGENLRHNFSVVVD